MKISLVQFDIYWENKAANLSKLEKLITPLYNNTDIVILPETFTTGFSMDPGKLAEDPAGETFLWMKRVAKDGNLGICGTYIIREGKIFHNRFVFVAPDGSAWKYDKRHLFGPGGENDAFSPGKKRLIFTFRDVRISPYICYDLRFPVWTRNRKEYDLMIFSANWPSARRDVWNTLLKARAIENQAYVAGVNRIGTDGTGISYSGESQILNSRGEIIDNDKTGGEGIISCTISLKALADFRKKFPVLEDADDFTLNV